MSWYQLLDVYAEAKAIRREQESLPPVACPHDGEPLLPASDGTLHCRFDGYTWPETASSRG